MWRIIVCAAILCFAAQSPQLHPVHPAGLDFEHRNSPTTQKYLIETMGGGVALLDYNNDGLLDIFFVNGGKLDDPVKSPVNFHRRDPVFWNRLYRQNRDGTFTDVTESAGLANAPNGYGMGVAVGDYDNDGFADLYVTNYGRNTLYHNNGNGTFTDVTEQAGVAAGGWSASAGFFDYDNDGRLDLFVTRYLDWDITRNILCGTAFHSYCRPDKFDGVTNLLFHNEGGGRFRDVSVPSGIGSVKGKSLGVAFNDYDGDGFADVFVANDGMEQFLFRNKGDGTFEERAMDAGVALSDDGKPFAGMGVAFVDYDNDGRPDILVTNLALEKYAAYRNEGNGRFEYSSLRNGLAGLTAHSSGWGVGAFDFRNSGWKDVFVAQGHVLDNVEKVNSGLRYREPPVMFRNVSGDQDGKFAKEDLGELPAVAGRGAAFGDLRNDGGVSVVMTVLGGQPIVFANGGGANHWLTLKLNGVRSNRDGAGAKVKVGNQWAYATASGSYLSASDGRVHFGLGTERETTVEIVWPSGRKQRLAHVAADRILIVKEPE
ncbi:MAG: CRTAC1 family protein [Acidobacteriota bacterium]|nr:CRTAC1 family protein [Acidobacteriota bacterium]